MYAVVRHGGHQYRVSPGDRLVVDRLGAEVGDVVGLAPVLLLSDADGVEVEPSSLEGVRVAATVAGHRRGTKIRVFTFKPKKRHRRTLGFRAELTELVVDRFVASGEPLPEPVDVGQWKASEPPAAQVAAPSSEAEPAAETETTPASRRRRRAAGASSIPSAEVEAAVEAAAPEPTAAPADAAPAVEAQAPRPARRSRKAAAAPEPEAAAPEETPPAAPSSATPKRRAARRTPEAS